MEELPSLRRLFDRLDPFATSCRAGGESICAGRQRQCRGVERLRTTGFRRRLAMALDGLNCVGRAWWRSASLQVHGAAAAGWRRHRAHLSVWLRLRGGKGVAPSAVVFGVLTHPCLRGGCRVSVSSGDAVISVARCPRHHAGQRPAAPRSRIGKHRCRRGGSHHPPSARRSGGRRPHLTRVATVFRKVVGHGGVIRQVCDSGAGGGAPLLPYTSARAGHDARLWVRDPSLVTDMQVAARTRLNPADVRFPMDRVTRISPGVNGTESSLCRAVTRTRTF